MAQELRHVKPSPLVLGCLMVAWAVHHFDVHYARYAKYVSDHSIFIVGKEISLEDVRLSIEKMVDRFHEHPHTVFVATNLYYYEVLGLSSRNTSLAGLNWQEIELEGITTHEFDAQISNRMQPILSTGWRTRTSEKTGNPLYVKPSALVVYRKEHCFALDSVILRQREAKEFGLMMASQPY